MAALDELYQTTPEAEGEEWRNLVDEVRSWLSEIPEEGLKIDGKKVLQWPVEDVEEEPTLRIRLVLRNTVALTGTLKRSSPHPADHREEEGGKKEDGHKKERDK